MRLIVLVDSHSVHNFLDAAVVQFLKDTHREGVCEVAIVKDEKINIESDSGDYQILCGCFATIGKEVASDDDIVQEATPAKLYIIIDGELKLMKSNLSKGLLENNRCYLFNCGVEIFVWVGKITQVDERKAAIPWTEAHSQNRLESTRVTRYIREYETQGFKSNLDSWPSRSATSAPKERRKRVAAWLGQQGVSFKVITKIPIMNEEVLQLPESDGKMEGWRIKDSAKTSWPKEDMSSAKEEQKMAAQVTNTMPNSLQGRTAQGYQFQGKEPPQLVLSQPMLILKGVFKRELQEDDRRERRMVKRENQSETRLLFEWKDMDSRDAANEVLSDLHTRVPTLRIWVGRGIDTGNYVKGRIKGKSRGEVAVVGHQNERLCWRKE